MFEWALCAWLGRLILNYSKESCSTFVSPVPQQPLPQTEDCTLLYVILQNFIARAICSTVFTWLSNPFFFCNVLIRRPSSGSTRIVLPDEGLQTKTLQKKKGLLSQVKIVEQIACAREFCMLFICCCYGTVQFDPVMCYIWGFLCDKLSPLNSCLENLVLESLVGKIMRVTQRAERRNPEGWK